MAIYAGRPEGILNSPMLPRMRSKQLFEKLSDLEAQMREMQGEIAVLHDRQAGEEVEALAAERVRSGAVEHTEDGAQALADLGIDVR